MFCWKGPKNFKVSVKVAINIDVKYVRATISSVLKAAVVLDVYIYYNYVLLVLASH
jgi:hypothetical protein